MKVNSGSVAMLIVCYYYTESSQRCLKRTTLCTYIAKRYYETNKQTNKKQTKTKQKNRIAVFNMLSTEDSSKQ